MSDENLATPIDVEALDEIYTWLDQIPFTRPRKNIARDFSNGVFMAELLKQYYPRYVELHNYCHGNSLARKIDNWRTLNRKVLSKISMKLSDKVIYQIATAEDKVIESILVKLRKRILKDCNEERKFLYSAYEDGDQSSIDTLLNFDEVQNKMIPKMVFLRVRKELDEKNEIVAILNKRISHLESLIKLKDQRISDLSTQIVRLENR